MSIKKIVLSFLALFFLVLLFDTPTHAQGIFNGKPNPNGFYGYDEDLPDLLNIVDLDYHTARPIIMSVGWKPMQTLQEESDDFEITDLSGNGELFWNKKYHELEACAGTGFAYCLFNFRNKNGDQLQIITKGEESPENLVFAKVAGYRFTLHD